MLTQLNEPHLSNFLIAEDINGEYIKYNDYISFSSHIGRVEYDFAQCRFIIRWLDDNSVRSLTSSFARELMVIPKPNNIVET